jgi:hypothetical protein
LWGFQGVDISEKPIVFLPNYAGPWSNQLKDWDNKPTWQKFLGSRFLYWDKIA